MTLNEIRTVSYTHLQPTTLRLLAENRPTLRFACCAWLCKPLVDAGVPVSQIDVLEPGHMYGYGICNVRPDMVKHNVPNCGWKVWLQSGKLFYCTDMNNLNGITAPNYDLYMVEANYDDAEIQAKIAEKKLNGEYIYELGVLHNHMSLAKMCIRDSPNTEVKLTRAQDSSLETARENR